MGVGQRLQSIRRIRLVQEQLKRLEERKLLTLNEQEAQLQAAQEALVGSLNEEQALHGCFVDLMARHLGRLAGESEAVRHSKDKQAKRVFDRASLVRHAERMEHDLSRQDRQMREDESLREMGDLIAARPRTSLP